MASLLIPAATRRFAPARSGITTTEWHPRDDVGHYSQVAVETVNATAHVSGLGELILVAIHHQDDCGNHEGYVMRPTLVIDTFPVPSVIRKTYGRFASCRRGVFTALKTMVTSLGHPNSMTLVLSTPY